MGDAAHGANAESKMVYVKSFLFGIAAAIAATALWILAVFVAPILLPFLLSRLTRAGGAAGAVIGSGSILAVALVGFAAGFAWEFRRAKRVVKR